MIKRDRKACFFQRYRDNAGFTLVELLITMVIFVLVLASASSVFTGLLTQFKQQGKITETNIEGAVGLEMLRRDLESAGYGLPWNIPTITYNEAASTSAPANNYNDGNGVPTTVAPRAIVGGNNLATYVLNNSDYLAIKAVNVGMNDVCQKWTFLKIGNTTTVWTPSRENVNVKNDGTADNTVKVVVINPGSTDTNRNTLVVNAGQFYTEFNSTSLYQPTDTNEIFLIYGIKEAGSPIVVNPRFPFNRADYYVRDPGGGARPSQCAPGTGMLYKATVNHADGDLTRHPILDCVADMQVIYSLDMSGDGIPETFTNPAGDSFTSTEVGMSIATITGTLNDAALLRARLKAVQVYILAHEGQIDRSYTYPNPTITLGDNVLGSNFDLAARIGGDWRNYRWKVYSLIIKPKNLR